MSISTPYRRRAVGRTATIAAAAAVMVAAGTAVQADDGPLKIGALAPMTGDLQAYGQTSLNGIELAAKEINDAGGVLGNDLEIELGDTQTTPQAGIDAAKQLD